MLQPPRGGGGGGARPLRRVNPRLPGVVDVGCGGVATRGSARGTCTGIAGRGTPPPHSLCRRHHTADLGVPGQLDEAACRARHHGARPRTRPASGERHCGERPCSEPEGERARLEIDPQLDADAAAARVGRVGVVARDGAEHTRRAVVIQRDHAPTRHLEADGAASLCDAAAGSTGGSGSTGFPGGAGRTRGGAGIRRAGRSGRRRREIAQPDEQRRWRAAARGGSAAKPGGHPQPVGSAAHPRLREAQASDGGAGVHGRVRNAAVSPRA
mmetsp:Transcript_41850/g.136285  ORF Transcript_41850/g.136285 Transcript_41850/m.136285 type:complete len:270 (+) Transcript_41850:279-1088(+)